MQYVCRILASAITYFVCVCVFACMRVFPCSWLVMLISAVNVPVDECESTQLFWSLLCAQACVCVRCQVVWADVSLQRWICHCCLSDCPVRMHRSRNAQNPPFHFYLRLPLTRNCRNRGLAVSICALTHWAVTHCRFKSAWSEPPVLILSIMSKWLIYHQVGMNLHIWSFMLT